MADVQLPPRQASFLIGPPVGPADMKVLYQQAAAQSERGDHSLAQKLFTLRQSTVKYTATAQPAEKSMLQRILEEKLGKELAHVETEVAQGTVRGALVPTLTIDLQASTYADGTPIAADVSAEVMAALESALAFVFKAEWVRSGLL